jgi:hypothetical protein
VQPAKIQLFSQGGQHPVRPAIALMPGLEHGGKSAMTSFELFAVAHD